ncbi:hypothetical protein [Chitinophaga tropicalis]|uniref:Uncharacterized protein n=1 Tax=Chitinophaga tropicalis TaxID=2683588 RepID=A0A7K1UAQ3_9BACT|nr:hypothetical protein [Chitinophaga tropicalis]MVT11459.1 hypothetical protein [Chitinophaga tropicalis]
MKKAMIAASIVGAAAAGAILYFVRRNRVMMDDTSDTAEKASRTARRHLRKNPQKVNDMAHNAME